MKKKSFFRVFIKYIFPLFLLGCLLFWFLSTSLGTKSTLDLLQQGLPGKFTYQEIQGNLQETIVLSNVNYQHPDFHLIAKRITLKANLFSLFKNTLHFPAFTLEEGSLLLPKVSEIPLNFNTISGQLLLETPRLSETIKIEEFKGSFDNDPLEITGQLLLKNKRLQEINGLITFGSTQIQLNQEKPEHVLWKVVFHPHDNFILNAKGILETNPHWDKLTGSILEMTFTGDAIETWTLKNPSPFEWMDNNLTISPLYFENMKGTPLLIDMNWDNIKGKLLKIKIPEFALDSPEIKGKFSLNLILQQEPHEPPKGEGELLLQPGRATINLPNNKVYETRFEGGNIKAHWDTEALNLSFHFKETPRNTVQANISVPSFSFNTPFSEQAISGNLSGKLQDLSIIYLLAPVISRLKGNIDLQGKIEGTVADPKVQLNAKMHEGIFSIPKQHITVKEFTANVTGLIPGELHVISSGTLGGKPFQIKGVYNPFIPNAQNIFEFSGDNIRVFNTANIHVISSPTLTLEMNDNNLSVTGDVRINDATITYKDELTQVITSHDVVLTESDPNEVSTNIHLMPDINLVIEKPEKLHFKGFGLDAIVRGKLKIERRPDGLYTGTGRLTIIEGKYRLQGSQYHIHRGLLLYPPGTLLNDPLLDIRIAKKQPGQIEEMSEVGIYIQGSLQNPGYNLYSSDNLENTEILSRLGFGGSQVEGGGDDKYVLSQTALFLASGVNPVIENIQSKLGLEEFSIQSADSQKIVSAQSGGYDTVLVVGKSLTKNIYLQFIQGMLEPLSLVRVKYFLSPKIAVSTETSTMETFGADLSFSLEQP